MKDKDYIWRLISNGKVFKSLDDITLKKSNFPSTNFAAAALPFA